MSDLFPIPHSEKPELERARERLSNAEFRWDKADAAANAHSILPQNVEDEWEEAWREWSFAKAELRRLEAAELERMKARQ